MKALNPISLIILLIGSMTMPAEALRAQAVTWTITPNSHASIDSKTGQVTVTSLPATEQTLKVTATMVQNGKTTIAEKDVVIERELPCIQAGDACWATGNVTYDPDTYDSSCNCYRGLKIADSQYDYGLFFQWFGGSGTDNVITGYATTGAWNSTPRYVQPGKAYGFPSGNYPSNNSTPYYGGYGYHSYGTNMTEWTGNTPCSVLGGGWRLPTKADFISIHPTHQERTYSMTGWTYSSSNGGYFKQTASGLVFPAAGFRAANGGLLTNQTTLAHLWSSTPNISTHSWCLWIFNSSFSNQGLYVSNHDNYKSEGETVRCVRN